jgi:hypothetical protein
MEAVVLVPYQRKTLSPRPFWWFLLRSVSREYSEQVRRGRFHFLRSSHDHIVINYKY